MDGVHESLVAQAGLMNELMSDAMAPLLREAGMSIATFELISAAHALRSRATQAEVARRLGITPPSLSESIRGAVIAGWVTQRPGKRDARTKLIEVTPKGAKAFNTVLKAIGSLESQVVAGLSEEEVSRAVKVLARANRNLAVAIQEMGDETN